MLAYQTSSHTQISFKKFAYINFVVIEECNNELMINIERFSFSHRVCLMTSSMFLLAVCHRGKNDQQLCPVIYNRDRVYQKRKAKIILWCLWKKEKISSFVDVERVTRREKKLYILHTYPRRAYVYLKIFKYIDFFSSPIQQSERYSSLIIDFIEKNYRKCFCQWEPSIQCRFAYVINKWKMIRGSSI